VALVAVVASEVEIEAASAAVEASEEATEAASVAVVASEVATEVASVAVVASVAEVASEEAIPLSLLIRASLFLLRTSP
jgi:hypothetical protein